MLAVVGVASANWFGSSARYSGTGLIEVSAATEGVRGEILALTDANGDGRDDIFTVITSQGQDSLYLYTWNVDAFTFNPFPSASPIYTASTGETITDACIGDVIRNASAQGPEVYVFVQPTGSGNKAGVLRQVWGGAVLAQIPTTFVAPPTIVTAPLQSTAGYRSFVLGIEAATSKVCTVAWQVDSGAFSPCAAFPPSAPLTLADYAADHPIIVADVSGDCLPDILFPLTAAVMVLPSIEPGVWAASEVSSVALPAGAGRPLVRDVTSDAAPDLIVGVGGTDPARWAIVVYRGTASGGDICRSSPPRGAALFDNTTVVTSLLAPPPTILHGADFDRDGGVDLYGATPQPALVPPSPPSSSPPPPPSAAPLPAGEPRAAVAIYFADGLGGAFHAAAAPDGAIPDGSWAAWGWAGGGWGDVAASDFGNDGRVGLLPVNTSAANRMAGARQGGSVYYNALSPVAQRSFFKGQMDARWRGAVVGFRWLDDASSRLAACALLPTASHRALDSGACVFGLGATYAFVEHLVAAGPFASEPAVFDVNVVPNAQVRVVAAADPDSPSKWELVLFVTPSQWAGGVLLAFALACTVLAAVIVGLQLRERRADAASRPVGGPL